MGAIHTSLRRALPNHDPNTFLSELGPDEDIASNIFANTVQALSLFTTTPPAPDGTWHQCAGCLWVANGKVTPES